GDGSYQFHAVVTDPAGNSSTTAAIAVIVDNTAPKIGRASCRERVDISSQDATAITKDGSFDLNLSGNGDPNGTSVAYGVSPASCQPYCATDAAQSNLGDGSYQFHAVVTDPAGNSSTTAAIAVIVDNTAP